MCCCAWQEALRCSERKGYFIEDLKLKGGPRKCTDVPLCLSQASWLVVSIGELERGLLGTLGNFY